MANPQPNEFTKISNELYSAIMQTDFTKRQRNIIDLVIRMSYGCGKKSALLKYSDFQLVGVHKSDIKTELEYLRSTKVIFVDGERVTLNKDYDQWRVSLIKTYSKEKWNSVLSCNLNDRVGKTLTIEQHEEVGISPTNYEKTVCEIPTLADESWQNTNNTVGKIPTTTPLEPLSDAGYRAPKESIKEISSSISTNNGSDDSVSNEKRLIEAIENHMELRMGKQYAITGKAFSETIQLLKDNVPIDIIIRGINESFDNYTGSGIKSFSYCIPKIYELHQREQAIKDASVSFTNNVTPFVKPISAQRSNVRPDKYDVFYQLYQKSGDKT